MAHATGAGTDIHVEPKKVLDTIGHHMLVDGFPIVVDLEKSEGIRLRDKADGRTYVDFFQFFASLPIGINHPKLTDPKFREQLGHVAVNKPSNSDFYSQQMAEFVEAMDRFAIPRELPHMFLIEGGALGIENALKAAFDWKVQKNYKRGATKDVGQQVIHFREAFHGRTGYTIGTFELNLQDSGGNTLARTGKYITIWQKQSDGQWKVVADTAVFDSPPVEPSK